MRGRGLVTVVAVIGAAVAGISAQVASSSVGALALALLAGIGASLLVRGGALRALGVVLVILATGGAVVAGTQQLWATLAGFAIASLGCLGMIAWGPNWVRQHRSDAERPVDYWQAMDAGEDPTGEQSVHAPSDAR